MSTRDRAELRGWPSVCDPRDRAWVFAHNELVIAADPHLLWHYLIRAEHWPRWYANAHDVDVLHGKKLRPNCKFTWTTFSLPIESTVTEFHEPDSLGWCWRSRAWRGAAWGYHAWRLEPHPRGTRVITEEAQRGFLPWALRLILRPLLHWGHRLWLRDLAVKAANARPASADAASVP